MASYQFTRECMYKEWGVVTADSEEEALKKVKKGQEDDVLDMYRGEPNNDSIEIVEEVE